MRLSAGQACSAFVDSEEWQLEEWSFLETQKDDCRVNPRSSAIMSLFIPRDDASQAREELAALLGADRVRS